MGTSLNRSTSIDPAVLVAEDDADIRELIAETLSASGYSVSQARDGEEALAIALDGKFDVGIFDVMMPRLDGLELTRRLRDNASTQALPILLLTACTDGQSVARGFEAGADDYVKKPFNFTELETRITAVRERGKRVAQLLEDALCDGLTGLPNRRAWDDSLPRLLSLCGRTQNPICVAMIDIDHFKEFNDTSGHQEGDRLLREIAAGWQQHIRKTDVLARYGGDEFSLALPGSTVDQGRWVLERLRAVMPQGESCSAGIVQWVGTETHEDLVKRADEALYEAKRTGRDRIVFL